VPAAFGKINNQFIGILIGVLSAELYNRFYQVELPKYLRATYRPILDNELADAKTK